MASEEAAFRKQWLLASTFGWVGGLFLGLFSSYTLILLLDFARLAVGRMALGDIYSEGFFSIALLASGTVMGGAQWIVLSGEVAHAGRWFWASALGWFLVALVAFAVQLLAFRFVSYALQGWLLFIILPLAGTCVGGAQAFAYKSVWAKPARWIWWNVLVWTVLLLLAAGILLVMVFSGGICGLAILALGAVYGLASAGTLFRLFQKTGTDPDNTGAGEEE